MKIETVRQLSAVPPPPHRSPWKFKTSLSTNIEIRRLENLLGLPQAQLGFNLTKANERIAELEAMLVAKAPAAAPTLPAAAIVTAFAPAAPSPSIPVAARDGAPSLATLRSLCAHLFGADCIRLAGQSDEAQRTAIENLLRRHHVKVQGVDQSGYIERTGTDRAIAAILQMKAAKFLRNGPAKAPNLSPALHSGLTGLDRAIAANRQLMAAKSSTINK